MQEFISYLRQFKRLTNSELEYVHSKITRLTLQKQEFLSWEDREFAFVCQGVLRAVHVDYHGIEITEYFIDEGQIVPGPEQLTGKEGMATAALRQALIKTELAVISVAGWQELAASIDKWKELQTDLSAKAEADRIAALRPALAGDATTCYRDFLEKFPQIAARIPLSYLASYLGITQQSLSRIRLRVAKNAYRPAR